MKNYLSLFLLLFLLAPLALGQKNPSTTDSKRQQKSSQTKPSDQKIRITYKPRPAYPDQSNGSVCIQGTVILRVQFLETAEIGNIGVVKGLPYGLTENAIEAAK